MAPLRGAAAAALVVGFVAVVGAPAPVAQAQDGQGCVPPIAATPGAGSAFPERSPSPEATPSEFRMRDSAGNELDVVTVPTAAEPAGLDIDSTDPYARVFVAGRGSDRLSIFYGRSPSVSLACELVVGERPYGVAVDDTTGTALVALEGEPRVAIIEGRGDQPRVVGSVELPAEAGWVAIDQETRRAFVSMPGAGQVALLEPSPDGGDAAGAPYRLITTFDAGRFPFFVAVDQEDGRLLVSDRGQGFDVEGDQGEGQVLAFDGRATPPIEVAPPIPASVPTGIAFDPESDAVWVLENGDDLLATVRYPPDFPPTIVRTSVDSVADADSNLNPVDLVLLPATRELVVTMSMRGAPVAGHLNVHRLDTAGTPTWDRSIPAEPATRGITLDPVTGRVFTGEVDTDRLAALDLDVPSEPAPPPTSIAVSMPGPLEISIAPEDIARSVGISLVILLLVGAPTPLFNETLESHLGVIQGWLGAGRVRRREHGRFASFVARAQRFSQSPGGIAIYVAIAALIYSFLTPGFPGQDALLVFGVACLGIGLATAADGLPGDRYVVRRYRSHGTVRVALWTLALAAVCVLISRLAGMNPGYMYGIIGTFAFAVSLSTADEGRMEALGAVALLALALAAWFARIPFEPPPGVPTSGPNLIINAGLVGIFIVAVEGLVFGLVPLSFLPGARIFAWSRWRWLLLWGAGLALFLHVLVFPVTVVTPNPDPASLTTTLVSVGLYGAIAVGFWLFFRWYDARPRPATAPAGPIDPERAAPADPSEPGQHA